MHQEENGTQGQRPDHQSRIQEHTPKVLHDQEQGKDHV